jgi:hypothetical protein
MWDPPSCEELLYNCCIGVGNLTFSKKEISSTLAKAKYKDKDKDDFPCRSWWINPTQTVIRAKSCKYLKLSNHILTCVTSCQKIVK